ncbi:sensor histidine kinase [Paenibacillus aceris]|uniref:histidine kinase n=1 Tax=Paenibacillus aceris TaxID=869555 RepID=A0ABS4I7Z9_9BACL|nr:ATP-binding protein [Paenibacillus aceris]MBP1967018.1 diguanylate cyclase (GGDEF)-like protein [Paenibacillus aceris]NHW33215.1 diguanylate cyclase [Paenibacillus aceris]
MVIKIIKHIGVPFICCLTIFSSITLGKAPSIAAVLLFGIAFYLSIAFERKLPFSPNIQFILLALFHWSSHLNWCLLLYYLLIGFAIENRLKYTSTFLTALLYIGVYSMIRLSYMPLNYYNLLVSIYDIASSIIFVLLVQFVLKSELDKKRLQQENDYLTTHDPLTGLLNYEGYVTTIENLIVKRFSFVLVLLDFQDFKSVNSENIHNGNETLNQISLLLGNMFYDSYAMSRYAGDQFAIILPARENLISTISESLDANILGFQVTYSFAEYPLEASTKEELISLAEERLFQNKRAVWLKREEHLFRSEKMKMIGELAAGMAHEIRNPLTTIKGFMQIATTRAYNIQPWHELIMSEIRRMNELTAEFLQFSKPHISNMKPESISDCLDRVLSLAESDALYRGHNIIFEDNEEALYIFIDRDKIVQVLLNLIQNAFEAMKHPGDVHVRIKQENELAIIEIEDSGDGMSEGELEKIFNPFYTTKENGTGLGLSICHKIAVDHGGSLEVKSAIGFGSIFSFKLPMVDM